jgi:hypothetical protein
MSADNKNENILSNTVVYGHYWIILDMVIAGYQDAIKRSYLGIRQLQNFRNFAKRSEKYYVENEKNLVKFWY